MTEHRDARRVRIAVIGAGPTGLVAALALALLYAWLCRDPRPAKAEEAGR